MKPRKRSSQKGENGKVLVVGGNEYFHGAPILAALAAEKSGVDLTYLMVPVNQQNLARQFSLNLIVDTFKGKFLRGMDVRHVVDWSKKADVMVIGNGLGEKSQTLRACRKIIEQSKCDLVIDAAALHAFVELKNINWGERQIVLTPHRGEFSRMIRKNVEKMSAEEIEQELKGFAEKWKIIIVLKGSEDLIVDSRGKMYVNKTGHPVMSKGGTGDVLAGLIGGLMAQGSTGFEAAKEATRAWGEVGEYVAQQKGTKVTIRELIGEFGLSAEAGRNGFR